MQLRLLVVGDPEIAAAAGQVQGEWHAQTGSDFQVSQTTEKELEAARSLPADAVICASGQLGALAERRLLAPSPAELLEKGTGWSEIFELLRLREAAWGKQVLAVPLGSPVWTCYYRPDLLEKLRRRPPQTWTEYQELAQLLADRKRLGAAAPPDSAPWSGTVEPLGPGWAGLVLLARAAPYAKHRSHYSTFFDIQTMEPLVAGPPFVRALEDLVAAAKTASPDVLTYDPSAARKAFWEGRCGMALTWPTAAAKNVVPAAKARIQVNFAELPGSTSTYSVSNRSWQSRGEDEDPHVPLLAIAGRIGVVAAKSQHPEAAFRLLLWLSGDQISPQVCAPSPATTLFRQSHCKTPRTWTEPPIPAAAAAQYAAATQRTLSREGWLLAPRLPGRAEYLAALDEAVQTAVRGRQPPAEALRHAAARWREITKRLGTESQRQAYLRSLLLE